MKESEYYWCRLIWNIIMGCIIIFFFLRILSFLSAILAVSKDIRTYIGWIYWMDLP